MKHKSEVFSNFEAFKAMVEKEKGTQIKVPRYNGGGEYFSNQLRESTQQIYPTAEWGCLKKTATLQNLQVLLYFHFFNYNMNLAY